jgi:hypothetical protein
MVESQSATLVIMSPLSSEWCSEISLAKLNLRLLRRSVRLAGNDKSQSA